MVTIISNKKLESIKKILEYSFEPIGYQYDWLTKKEKKLLTRKEFADVCKLIGKKAII